MTTVTLTELQQNTAGLLARVEAGEHIVVVCDDRPVAELRPITSRQESARPYGLAAGAFVVPDDFDAPLADDVLQEFEGQ
jgi:prevent-host-death family protein